MGQFSFVGQPSFVGQLSFLRQLSFLCQFGFLPSVEPTQTSRRLGDSLRFGWLVECGLSGRRGCGGRHSEGVDNLSNSGDATRHFQGAGLLLGIRHSAF